MKMPRLGIGHKVYGIVALSIACLISAALFELFSLKTGLEAQKQLELRHLTEVALRIIQDEHAAAARGVPMEEAKKRAAARVAALRYGGDEYFWINDMYPRVVMHPIKPELDGREVGEMKDPNGKRLFAEFVEVVKRQGSGIVAYEWPKPGASEPQPKLSYVAGFAPWGWIVGTGVYVDDLRDQIWAKAKEVMISIGGILLLLAGVTAVVTRDLSRALKSVRVAMNELAAGNFDVALPGLARPTNSAT